MQNFTLGKKGYAMLLFALVLLISSSPMFGQTNCPTVSDTTQDYCYLKTVSDLVATANGDNVKWYRSATSNTAIPSNELLQNGTYYAGNNSGTCTSRVAVTVSVDDIGAPTADFGNTYSPCEYSPGGTSTVQQLIASVNGNSVEIYDQEYSGSPLDPSTPLNEGSSYFAGQRNPSTNCPSSRLSLRYDPVLALAPDAVSPQTFCPGATVADLVATSTDPNFQAIRWYSTATSNPQLSGDTPLINGESYYASQIINRQGSTLPPCESRDRAEVIVEFQVIIPDETTQAFCVDSDDPTTTPKVQDLISPYGAPSSFFFDENFTILLDSQTDLINGADYYTANGISGASCEATKITVEFIEIPDAGEDVNEEACQTEFSDSNSLIARFSSLLVDRDPGGSISNESDLRNQFDTDGGVGVFTTTYTVTTGSCTDSAVITLTILEATPVEAGTIDNFEVCTNDAVITFSDLLSNDATSGGIFTNSDNDEVTSFDPQTATIGDHNFTYTVNGTTEPCTSGSDFEDFTITVNQAPNAGVNVNEQVCETELADSDALIAKFSSLLVGRDSGGTFSNNSIADLEAQYNSSPFGVFTTTYTVTNPNCTDTAEITITVVQETPAEAGTIEDFEVCTNDEAIELSTLLSADATPGGTFTNSDNDEITSFNPQTASLGDHDFTYTVNGSTETCTTGSDLEDFTITVNQAPNAGVDVNEEVCETELADSDALIARFSTLLVGRDSGGTFSNIPTLTALYNANPIGDFTTTYTVTNADCTDTAEITITVREVTEANAGAPVPIIFCVSENNDFLLTDFLADEINPLGTFEAPFESGSFNPSTLGVGVFEFDYTIDGAGDCATGTSSTTFTITILDVIGANAGADQSAAYCVSQDQDIDLITLIDPNASNTGSFSAPYESGVFNPSQAGNGEFSIIYTVEGPGDCAIGIDRATITITVNNPQTAPIAESNQSYCLIDSPTVGDLVVTGENVVIYSDADLTEVVDATTALVTDMTYYAVSTNEAGTCSSEATEITVTITDPSAPSLQTEGNEFCRSDNPTVQDLINNFTGSGVLIYTSSTGGSSIAATTALENGATYYGASVNGTTGCESTERLAVVAKVEFCGIPEGFSPNGDGINDRFVIPDIAENFPNYSIEIFNRWGNVVFKGNASTPDWDGISNQSGTLGNDVLPVGVYFYILNYNDGQTSPVQGKLYLSI